jgi:hypothetical protein
MLITLMGLHLSQALNVSLSQSFSMAVFTMTICKSEATY